jgi:hypothetical protein
VERGKGDPQQQKGDQAPAPQLGRGQRRQAATETAATAAARAAATLEQFVKRRGAARFAAACAAILGPSPLPSLPPLSSPPPELPHGLFAIALIPFKSLRHPPVGCDGCAASCCFAMTHL